MNVPLTEQLFQSNETELKLPGEKHPKTEVFEGLARHMAPVASGLLGITEC